MTEPGTAEPVRLFLCGDVMTGRGVDQVFPHSSEPELRERHVRSARRYVDLAEEAHGSIPEPVEYGYPWGDALPLLEEGAPDLRIVNLETAVTTSNDAWRGKGIHYRMDPTNVSVLRAASVDCCVLANNHVLDWGYDGLGETVETLREAGITTAGAGEDRSAAFEPAELTAREDGVERRVLIFGLASTDSGVPPSWAARGDRPGVSLLRSLDEGSARRVAAGIRERLRAGNRVVVSVHWGSNWGYRIPDRHRRFARVLVEEGGVDVIHGHSSHHPRGIEVVSGRPVLYGCGDFLNDYEGIAGRERFRGDLTLAYLVDLNADGALARLEMIPFRLRQFRLERPPEEDLDWMHRRMDRECRRLGTGVEREGNRLLLQV